MARPAFLTMLRSSLKAERVGLDGAGGPASKEVGAGFAGASAAVDFGTTQGYGSTLLASFTVTDLQGAPAMYPIDAGFFFMGTLANFLDSNINELDPQITFGSAVVSVIPEPFSATLLVMGAAVVCILRSKIRPAHRTVRNRLSRSEGWF